MNIVLIHRYFYPDVPPYASMLRTIANQLANDGHAVTVLTAQPSYRGYEGSSQPSREQLDGANVVRVPLLKEKSGSTVRRLMNLAVFSTRVFWKILRMKDCDVVMAATTPPILVAMSSLFGAKARRAKFVYHMQDIYPEVAVANPKTSVPAAGVLRWLDTFTTSRADEVVVLSADMAQSLKRRRRQPKAIRVINNFTPVDYAPPGDGEVPALPDGFNIVFAGNFGRFQGLTNIVEAMGLLDEASAANLIFIGQGAERLELEGAADASLGTRVFFLPRVDQSRLRLLLENADVGLVSLNSEIIRFAFPSKVFSYLDAGIPLLAQVEADSELAESIGENEIGLVFPPGSSPAEIVHLIAGLESANIDELRMRAKEYGSAVSSAAARLPEWSELFCDLNR